MAAKKSKRAKEVKEAEVISAPEEVGNPEFEPEIVEAEAVEVKKVDKKEIAYVTKKVLKDCILTTIYYKDGTSEERKSTDIKRA